MNEFDIATWAQTMKLDNVIQLIRVVKGEDHVGLVYSNLS